MLYRGMLESGGMPILGDSKKKLGVVTPPSPFPDVVPDSKGNVHPPGLAKADGMSAAHSIADLPSIRRPLEWGGRETSTRFKVWQIDETDLGPELLAMRDSPTHVTIAPARTMSIAEFRTALARTQDKWKMVTRP